jgi:hypothetical protein
MSEEDATCLIPVGWTLLTERRAMVQDDVAMQTPPRAEPKVRIHLPPAESLRTFGSDGCSS